MFATSTARIFAFHFLIFNFRKRQANRWCSQGIDLLASQQLEKCSSPEFAAQSLGDIEHFLASAADFRDPKEFRNLFKDIITPETKSLINQVQFIYNHIFLLKAFCGY